MALNPETDGYRELIRDYDGYRATITRIYLSNFAGSSDMRTVEQAQGERRSAAKALSSNNVGQWIPQSLKLLGFAQGSQALRVSAADHVAREKKFREETLPVMKKESGQLLTRSYDAAGRPDKALLAAIETARSGVDWPQNRVTLDRYFDETIKRLARCGDPLWDRVSAVKSARDYKHANGDSIPKELQKSLTRDFSIAAEHWLEQAQKASGPDGRQAALASAADFATAAGNVELLRLVEARKKEIR